MFDPLASIKRSALSPISFLSKLEWNCLGNCPASYFKVYSGEVINVEDRDDISYS